MKTKVFNYFFGGSVGDPGILIEMYSGLSHLSVLHGGNFCPLLKSPLEPYLRHLYLPVVATVSPSL